MKTNSLFSLVMPLALIPALILTNPITNKKTVPHTKTVAADAGLTLPSGFEASVVADNLGQARHLAITPQNDIYVKLNHFKNGKGILFLHQNGDKATVANSFGNYGGTGMYIKDGYLYASSDEDVYRYKLNAKSEVINPDVPEKIISGLLNRREHESKSIVLDNDGNIYVNVGAYSNSCQFKDRQKGSIGRPGCPILDSAGGIWQFKADKLDQHYGDGVHYAKGIRNTVGLDWNQQNNQLYVMQHGRDQLHDLFPDLYTVQQSAVEPAECLYALKKGDDAGWPYIYYDQERHEKILAPEYGGDSKKTAGEGTIDPTVAFPGHLAPDGLLFYTGNQFPERYKNGAFIAFHGSWNRAPEPQAGYFVVFQPFKDGKPDGKWEVFADGFAGTQAQKESGRAEHRPCGLAQGPDGSLYVSDDSKGTIYKITYKK
ncbi:Glucose/arabinose dehydrogenase, beta-propeller fold [Mucilaginibacter mallensis]|uniref:Glucose/arabinose dehydrogenase, beta-propeller fold n=1 Tax=Mucilaginibacter mallensis TaxID=652787 RepID=A0A1H1YMM2_MUCMA|nr:PQQ-dependent sugar dehydrogenase [Mucilaginibacter mallensis]SDT22336.1 Glucose/arabinose dehydrogenase, beta-propeller fold [Mucilaginibacter mallensis]